MKDPIDRDQIDEVFDEAAQFISSNLPKKVDPDTVLELYGLYKQATQGDALLANTSEGWSHSVKLNAWQLQEGKSTAQAKQEYTKLATKLGFKRKEVHYAN